MAESPLLPSLHYLLIFLLLNLILPPNSSSLKAETRALLEFKSWLKDLQGYLDSWKDSTAPCGFYGVSCDPVTGSVTGIVLDNVSLSGEISPNSLVALKSLTSLVITSNFITGQVPVGLNSLTELKVLNLSMNRMVGQIPDLTGLMNLEVLDLSGNFFSGDFPSWVGNLIRLVRLGIANNDFDEGVIPANLGDLKNLTWLFLSNCNRIGEIPESVFGLKELDTLDLSKNKISGTLSSSISELRKLTKIELFANNMSGEIPVELGYLALLQEIDISANHFYGELPQELGNLKNLTVFQSYENNFTGKLPPGFGDLNHLKAFSIYKNSFWGTFPQDFGRFSPLNSIDISENNFSGPFPSYLCESGNLQFLLALGNDFSGEFPASYADCKPLIRFRVNQNRLSGPLADAIWALPSATIIDFSDNCFTGHISPQIGLSASLTELILVNNRFSGQLPPELGKLVLLERLCLSNNSFSGEIPPQIGYLKQLSSLQLQMNALTGSIPAELGQCTGLADLNLAMNSLSGDIPSTLSSASSLNSLNLSNNRLEGQIPQSLANLKLSLIDLAYNQLSGTVPLDLLQIGTADAFAGNKGLCIDPPSLGTDPSYRRSSSTGLSKVHFTCIILSALTIVLLVFLLWSCCYKLRRNNGIKSTDTWKLESFHPLEFDVEEIFNLKEVNLIGNGGGGRVYRLDLKKNSMTVAVKQLFGFKVPTGEMDILGRIRHRNILKLYACLVNQGSGFLVFEFMANGNLFELLHGEEEEVKGSSRKMDQVDWYTRYRIALGVAKGIAYLHHDCSPPVIHRDIKSTNILLDDNYEPKIADFGIAKAAAENSLLVSQVSLFAGTHGYIAPEMAYTVKISEKSDVYSYGVVLLELLTGRRPTDHGGEGGDIVQWVLKIANQKAEMGIDVLLDSRVATDDNIKAGMLKVLKIAIRCIAVVPSQRPTMRDVVKLLMDADPHASSTTRLGSRKSQDLRIFV
ncbi:hypothetical protein Dimus_025421 [Dionaea muscipula]